MSSKRPSVNPLLGASNFKIEDSFGPQPALIVPTATSTPASASNDPFLGVKTHQQSSSLGPPPVMSLGPPQPGLFLLPTSTGTPNPPPVMTLTGTKPRSRYVPPPGIHASSSSGSLNMMSSVMTPTSMIPPTIPAMQSSPSMPVILPPAQTISYRQGPELYPGQNDRAVELPKVAAPDEPLFHWYYKVLEKQYNVLNPTQNSNTVTESWRPFSMRDSMSLEYCYGLDHNTNVLIATDGGRYDVDIPRRKKVPVYWRDGLNDEMEVRRASWFYKTSVNTWIPYDEELASRLEQEFQSCHQTGSWKREIRIKNDESIRMISPSMIYHFPNESSIVGGKLDEWGQVQPPSQDPSHVPREVHRGLAESIADDIPDGEDMACDHLVFVIHGIGAACDVKFRPIHEVVDSFRDLTYTLSKKHFQRAHLTEQVSRVEFLPVNWHKTLHGEDTGLDQRLRPLTLKSIPKLRNFVNDTLLDILFYTSPIYCQKILDTVVSEVNRLYTLFCERNEDFKGKVSIMGHSLGSLITFDLLSHQTASDQVPREVVEKPLPETDLTLEQVFAKLDISEFSDAFTKEGIDMESLMLCSEEDLKEGGLPLGPRKKLLKYLEIRKAITEHKLSGLEEYQEMSITSEVKYRIGPAGTGQPSVFYPKLDFEPASFYALGSPIALFHAVRGISDLGANFKLPTCPKFFNIFHPYDPVAYRVESMIDKELANLRPVTIPHHAGRKRMHLELKETVTKLMTGDLKKKLMDSVWSSLSAIYNSATGATMNEQVNEAVERKLEEDEALDSVNPSLINSQLNDGKRIDYVLQEAPYESFNEYVFALGSHLCYWNSEDTCLMILKDIYATLGVVSDEQLAMNEAGYSSMSLPAAQHLDDVPTAILRPAEPSPAPAPSSLVPPGSMPASSYTTPTNAALPPQPQPQPPVMMMPSTAFVGGPPPAVNNIGRPRRAIYPTADPLSTSGVGMDPTAPVSDKALGPPPPMGFTR